MILCYGYSHAQRTITYPITYTTIVRNLGTSNQGGTAFASCINCKLNQFYLKTSAYNGQEFADVASYLIIGY